MPGAALGPKELSRSFKHHGSLSGDRGYDRPLSRSWEVLGMCFSSSQYTDGPWWRWNVLGLAPPKLRCSDYGKSLRNGFRNHPVLVEIIWKVLNAVS